MSYNAPLGDEYDWRNPANDPIAETCPVCNMDGVIEVDEEIELCPNCNGLGFAIPDKNL